jgi:hypothetical protein
MTGGPDAEGGSSMTREEALELLSLAKLDSSGVPPLDPCALARVFVAIVSEDTVRDLDALTSGPGLPLK